jgi:DNA-binding transcriptional ArsR family regulator
VAAPDSAAPDSTAPDIPSPEHGRSQIITHEPERMRALAHPLRLRLLDILVVEGNATATRCAGLTGESVASCSFHLRMLAKYGFIEPAERRGRERPWQMAARSLTATYNPEVPESLPAAGEVVRAVVGQEMLRIEHLLDALPSEDDRWVLSSVVARSVMWVTADEMAEISKQVTHLTDRFADRRDNPALRPVDARLARMFAVVNAEPAATQPTPATPAWNQS